MFVCLCNALKEKEVHCAIAQGAACAADIYAALGCAPKCGRCIPYVETQLLGQQPRSAPLCPAA